eukprot:3121885-Rhodomonas_salina.2
MRAASSGEEPVHAAVVHDRPERRGAAESVAELPRDRAARAPARVFLVRPALPRLRVHPQHHAARPASAARAGVHVGGLGPDARLDVPAAHHGRGQDHGACWVGFLAGAVYLLCV